MRLPNLHKIPPEVYFESSGSPEKKNLGINPIDNAELCYPHDNIAGSHLSDECKRSSVPIRRIEQVCLLSTKCLVYKFVPSTNMSRQFVSIHRIIPPLIQAPPS